VGGGRWEVGGSGGLTTVPSASLLAESVFSFFRIWPE